MSNEMEQSNAGARSRPRAYEITLLQLIGASALGVLAIGALSIGAGAIGRLSVRRVRLGEVIIDDLTVRRMTGPPTP